jgi:hypothetical protein
MKKRGGKVRGARREARGAKTRGAKGEGRGAKTRGAGGKARGARGEARGAKSQGAKGEARGTESKIRKASDAPVAKKLAGPAAPREIDAIRRHIQDANASRTPRWNADPEDVRRSVLKLVLTLVELIRQLLERQAIRRMEGGTLSDEETESVGLALMKLQDTITELAAQFDISPDELNLDLGPVGKLL